jgi:ABC-type antimicrobial peptide transport system permease subunit
MGSLVGIIVSAVIISILGRVGLTRTLPESIAPITVYPFVSPRFMFASLVLGVVSAVVASIYPARRALAVNPVDALRST